MKKVIKPDDNANKYEDKGRGDRDGRNKPK